MNSTLEDVVDSGQYCIKEAAKKLGISRETLRRHTDKGNIRVNRHRYTGKKYYTGTELRRFWGAKMGSYNFG